LELGSKLILLVGRELRECAVYLRAVSQPLFELVLDLRIIKGAALSKKLLDFLCRLRIAIEELRILEKVREFLPGAGLSVEPGPKLRPTLE
jgi:hypothetical protein